MGTVSPIKRPPLSIIHWEVGVDLRTLGWNRRDVERIVRKYKLKHGQAVIFFNNAKEFGGSGSHSPKCRLYWVWRDQGCTIIPPVDEGARQVSYQLKLNEWLRTAFGCTSQIVDAMNGFDTALERRLAARQAAKKRKAG